MGGAASIIGGNPLDEAAQAKINDTTQEALKIFGTEFTKAYTQAVVQKAKDEVEPEKDILNDLKLQEAPIPAHVLKIGMLTKRGGFIKNWKNRCFVAYNKADNFKIDYHDGTSEAGKLKGTIHCAGYKALEFTADDVKEMGSEGIKLVPASYRRRTWWIKCPDERDRKDWLGVFENACHKATPPRDKDECFASAFDEAMRQLRMHYLFMNYNGDAGGEDERLGEFILDLLDREVVNEVIGKIVEGPAKSMTVEFIHKTVGTTVKAACSSAWISSSTAVRSMSGTVQNSVKQLIGPVLEKQKEFKAKIVQMISGTIDPFLAEKGGALLKPVFDVLCTPVTETFVLMAKGFHQHMKTKLPEFAPARFDATLAQCDAQMDQKAGPLAKAFERTNKLCTSEVTKVAKLLTGSVTPHSIAAQVRDGMQTLARRGVATFGKLGKPSAQSELPAVLLRVTAMLLHDCLIMVRSVLAEVLTSLLEAPIAEMVVVPSQAVIAPLQKMVEAIPVPGLPMLLDLNAIMEQLIAGVEANAIDAIISKSVAQAEAALEAAKTELGAAGVKI